MTTEAATGAFERHLRDAITLNRARAPVYAALSGGRSRLVSEPLIASERVLLPLARWYDRRAAAHRAAGVPLLDVVFVPMTGLGDAVRVSPPGEPLPDPGARGAATREIAASVRRGDDDAALAAISGELARLDVRAVDAMRRHLLESLRRVLTVIAPLERASAARGLPSPAPLLRGLARRHLLTFAGGDLLDDLARPFQRRGIPILAHDLPAIPAWRASDAP